MIGISEVIKLSEKKNIKSVWLRGLRYRRYFAGSVGCGHWTLGNLAVIVT